jgi:hypothetical protein
MKTALIVAIILVLSACDYPSESENAMLLVAVDGRGACRIENVGTFKHGNSEVEVPVGSYAGVLVNEDDVSTPIVVQIYQKKRFGLERLDSVSARLTTNFNFTVK